MKERQLSEVISFLVLIDNTRKFVVFSGFFSHKLPLKDDVEFVSGFTLIDNILAFLVFFFLENVQERLPKLKYIYLL